MTKTWALSLLVLLPLHFAAAAPAMSETPPLESSCAEQSIVLFSDSHGLTPFGDRLEQRFQAHLPDWEYETWNIGGSAPFWWFQGITSPHSYLSKSCPKPNTLTRARERGGVRSPLIEKFVAERRGKFKKQLYIIALGTNIPGDIPVVYGQVGARMIATILREPNTECVWIGPPQMRSKSGTWQEHIYAGIKSAIDQAEKDTGRRCRLIDSRPISKYPAVGGDGTHYPRTEAGISAGTAWADGVVDQIEDLLPNTRAAIDPPKP